MVQKKNPRAKKAAAPAHGRACVRTTFNNTIVTITDLQGNTVTQCSGGRTAKGSRKSLAHAAEQAALEAGNQAKARGMKMVTVVLKGGGNGRDASIRGLVGAGLAIDFIIDATSEPHGGCRARKQKRI